MPQCDRLGRLEHHLPGITPLEREQSLPQRLATFGRFCGTEAIIRDMPKSVPTMAEGSNASDAKPLANQSLTLARARKSLFANAISDNNLPKIFTQAMAHNHQI